MSAQVAQMSVRCGEIKCLAQRHIDRASQESHWKSVPLHYIYLHPSVTSCFEEPSLGFWLIHPHFLNKFYFIRERYRYLSRKLGKHTNLLLEMGNLIDIRIGDIPWTHCSVQCTSAHFVVRLATCFYIYWMPLLDRLSHNVPVSHVR